MTGLGHNNHDAEWSDTTYSGSNWARGYRRHRRLRRARLTGHALMLLARAVYPEGWRP